MENKKILFVFRTLGTGGAQKIQAFVADICVDAGYEVKILSMSNDKTTINLNPVIKIEYLDYDIGSQRKMSVLFRIVWKFKYLISLRKRIIKYNPDLVIVFLVDIIRIITLALLGTKIKILGSERGDPGQYRKTTLAKYNKALNKCSGVAFQLEDASRYYNISGEIETTIIPNPAFVKTNINSMKVLKKQKYIFGAGRLVVQKRFDLLIMAFKKIEHIFPEYSLRIFGYGPEYNNLKKIVDNQNIQEKVEFVGDVYNVFENIDKNDIFVLTSDYEGIPNILMESIIYGIPSISTDCTPGGARLLLDNGRYGTIVPKGDIDQIAYAIMDYIKNKQFVIERAKNGLKYIQRFSSESIKNQWLNFIYRVLY